MTSKQLLSVVVWLSAMWVATAQNADCALIVPPNPLSAQGLATPFYLTALDPAAGPCNQANPAQTTFVQGSIIDLDTGKAYVYNPLVIDAGTRPYIAPVVPQLPCNYVAALWFGTNAATLTLLNTPNTNSLTQGMCVNGGGHNFTVFGQFAYCNAVEFFAVANRFVQSGQLVVPQVGKAKDGLQCPTVRDFAVIDQDQSDNVDTKYLLKAGSQTKVVQDTRANRRALGDFTVLVNPSDNLLVTDFILPAIGCRPWTLPDLADPGTFKPALPYNEILASVRQSPPQALIPVGDPMVLDGNGATDLNKLNDYRLGVDQPVVVCASEASTTTYCANFACIAPFRFQLDSRYFARFASPAATSPNLLSFLIGRFNGAYTILGCDKLLHRPSPLINALDANGNVLDNAFNNLGSYQHRYCSSSHSSSSSDFTGDLSTYDQCSGQSEGPPDHGYDYISNDSHYGHSSSNSGGDNNGGSSGDNNGDDSSSSGDNNGGDSGDNNGGDSSSSGGDCSSSGGSSSSGGHRRGGDRH
jgi:hypothetical protein